MPNEAKQRFLDLTVQEISLVDAPANEVEFLVVKRLNDTEGEPMPNANTNPTDGAVEQQTTKKADAEVVSVDAGETSDQAVTKALEQVNQLVRGIADTVQAVKSANAPAPAPAPAPAASEEDVEKTSNPARKVFKAQLEKAGVKGEALKSALAEYDAETKKASEPAEKPAAETSTKKGTEESEELTDATKALEALSEVVEKAKKFTPKRQEALKQAIGTLSSLLSELSPSADAASSDTANGGSGLVSLTKAIEGLTETVTKALAEVQETTKALGARVETVEKARNAPSALPPENNDQPETVKKSFWSGVI